jgi:hypothetical protein
MATEYSPEYATKRPDRVPFGDGPDDSVPHSWAAHMLAGLLRENPRLFGKLLTAAATNEQS